MLASSTVPLPAAGSDEGYPIMDMQPLASAAKKIIVRFTIIVRSVA
jgi:hypothetical protein